ncbi:MAG: ribonuclease E inhibitor RraB [Maricaulis sp.]|nr:ribonuclease E inhibitor RraB [Maricaulis sp.]
MKTYPDDADGMTLKRIADSGSDMGCSMVIDFTVVAPNQEIGTRIELVLNRKYQLGNVYYDDELNEWSVVIAIEMIPDYSKLLLIQSEIQGLVEPLGGTLDGWGSYGNSSG